MIRKQQEYILKDLNKKMVFITGPRQVGKTWLAKKISENYNKTLYLNFDNYEDRKIIKNQSWFPEVELIILDEIHKMPDWKTYIKGIYDTKSKKQKIIVTGSSGLDYLKQSGDSLAGRYFRHRLLPFSISEIKNEISNSIDKLIHRGGFPEPFLSDNEEDALRWRMQYIDGLIKYDILDFEKIHDFKAMHNVLETLRH
ncbi:MAG TPA: AAA family ATPase [bacterium]|nr:AAA family ATPase [bacterium]